MGGLKLRVSVRRDQKQDLAGVLHLMPNLVAEAAYEAERRAKLYAPVDTGRLRSSIRTEIVSPTEATVSTDVEYASYQEFGTTTQPGKAFMRPALMDVEAKLAAMARDAASKANP